MVLLHVLRCPFRIGYDNINYGDKLAKTFWVTGIRCFTNVSLFAFGVYIVSNVNKTIITKYT